MYGASKKSMKVYDVCHRIPSATTMVNKLNMIELKIFDFSLKNYAKIMLRKINGSKHDQICFHRS